MSGLGDHVCILAYLIDTGTYLDYQ
jgi:hypothetical protein